MRRPSHVGETSWWRLRKARIFLWRKSTGFDLIFMDIKKLQGSVAFLIRRVKLQGQMTDRLIVRLRDDDHCNSGDIMTAPFYKAFIDEATCQDRSSARSVLLGGGELAILLGAAPLPRIWQPPTHDLQLMTLVPTALHTVSVYYVPCRRVIFFPL